MSVDWDVVGYVISSRYRITAVEMLADDSATPTAIASNAAVSTTHISKALQRLRDRSVVTMSVPPDAPKQRIYELTAFGRRVWDAITSNRLVS